MFEFSDLDDLQPVSEGELLGSLRKCKNMIMTPYCVQAVKKLNSKYGSENRVLLVASLAGVVDKETVLFSCCGKSNVKRVIWIYDLNRILLLPSVNKKSSMRIILDLNKERDYVFDTPTSDPSEAYNFLNIVNTLWKQRTESDKDLKLVDLRKEINIKYKRDKNPKPKYNIGTSIARMRWPKQGSLDELLGKAS